MPKFSTIIFDLDGTAIPMAIDGMPSQALIDTTRKYNDALNLCAATGRSWNHTKAIVEALGLNKPCIISGGTQIINPLNEEIVWEAIIDVATANRMLDIAKQFPYPVYFSRGLEVPDILDTAKIVIDAPINTFYILNIDQAYAARIEDSLAKIPGITASRAGSWSTGGVDLHITSNQATKEQAITELCRILGVEPAQTAGVGDNFNDLHLFKAVGYKVAVGNAVEELKAAADEVIDGLDNDGLAKFIASSAL